jgi:hypothetical protein
MNHEEAKHVAHAERTMLMMGIALRVLGARVVTITTLLLNAGVTSWAMWSDSWVRLAGAAVFGITSWCLVSLKPREGDLQCNATWSCAPRE